MIFLDFPNLSRINLIPSSPLFVVLVSERDLDTIQSMAECSWQFFDSMYMSSLVWEVLMYFVMKVRFR